MRRLAVAAILLALPAAVLAHGLSRSSAGSEPGASAATTTPPVTTAAGGGRRSSKARPLVPVVRRVGTLPAPVQDPAVTVLGGRVYAFGGLDAAQQSIDSVTTFAGASAGSGGRLPVAIHDAAAASVGGRLYVFGGGQLQSYAGIGAFDPTTGTTRVVTSLPTPLSDLAAATIGSTAYLVGGYTGAVFSDRIVAFSGGRARTVGRLPVGLRYAAVAPLGGAVLIAGGRTTSGPSAAVYRFDPAGGRVTRIGTLPHPVMHASAGVLGGVMEVVGGIGSSGPTRDVVSVTAQGKTSVAARLPQPLSDAGVATLPGALLVVGGAGAGGPVASVLRISLGHAALPHKRPAAGPAHPSTGASAAGRPPKGYRGALPGDLLIADRGNNRILLINPAGRILWRYPSRPGQARLNFDDDTFFADGGRRIISNQEEDHNIVQISYPAGRIVWRYGHPGVRGSAPGYLNTPDDAYMLPNGLITVADAYNCRILEIRGHRVVRQIGDGTCAHNPPTSLGAVNGDTPTANGHLLVSEINGSYIDDFTLGGKLLRVYKAPVAYPSDPQLTPQGNIVLADYSRPGGVVILNRRTGALMWSYRVASGPGMLDHPSLAAMLPNGDVIVGDDFNDRIVIIDPHTNRIVWQYGHTAVGGTSPGYLHIPDGFDFVPVTPAGKADPAAIVHGPGR
jgi:outer membrane protein assembly factor BamB